MEDALRRHPARHGVDLDDHQRDGDHPAGAVRRGRPAGRGSPTQLSGTIQNDILKEYVARGTYIYPAAALAAHRHRHLRVLRARAPELEHDLDQRLPHPRGRLDRRAGGRVHASPTRSPTCRRRSTPGSTSTAFGQRLSFFFNAHNDFLEEIAKYRAARRLWARIMRDRFGATNPRAQQLRFHTQTAGSTLTAQQPDNNIVRVALQALAAVLGGTQSLHCNGRDEALALPTEESARIALRTQQIIASEAGVANTVDPLGGSFAIEELTDGSRPTRGRCWTRSTRRAARSRRSRRASSSARSRTRPTRRSGRSTAARRRRRREPLRDPTSGRRSTCWRSIPEIERRQVERVRAVRASRDASRLARRARRGRRRRGATGNLVPRHRPPSRRAPPWARSPTRCAPCSASTGKSMSNGEIGLGPGARGRVELPTPDLTTPLLSVEHLTTGFDVAAVCPRSST